MSNAKSAAQSPVGQEHPLETPWSFWVDLKAPGKFQEYVSSLQCLGTCHSVEEFFSFYTHLVRPYDLPKNTNFHFFRHHVPPAWESYPNGGCWIVKIKKESGMLARLWEKLLLSVVGESLEEPEIVGLVLSIRMKEDVISVWCSDMQNRFRVADKIKRLLRLGTNAVLEFKSNLAALQDHSSFRNANKFFVEHEALSPPPTPPISLLATKMREYEARAAAHAAAAAGGDHEEALVPRPASQQPSALLEHESK